MKESKDQSKHEGNIGNERKGKQTTTTGKQSLLIIPKTKQLVDARAGGEISGICFGLHQTELEVAIRVDLFDQVVQTQRRRIPFFNAKNTAELSISQSTG